MSMPGGPHPPGADDAKLSWREREMLTALKRLANAQLQVAQVEAQLDTAPSPALDPDDVADVRATAAELAKLAKKSQSRFGGGSARERVNELESRQRLVLTRLGFESYDAFLAADATPTPGAASVDPVVVDFARRELAAAESAYRELLELPDEPVNDLESDEPLDDGSSSNGSGPTIDLTGS